MFLILKFQKGEAALKGKMRADFYALLEKQKEQVTIEEKRDFQPVIEKEKQKLRDKHDEEKTRLCKF